MVGSTILYILLFPPKNWGTCSILHFRRAETTNHFMIFELSLFIYMTMWHANQYMVNHQPANHQIEQWQLFSSFGLYKICIVE